MRRGPSRRSDAPRRALTEVRILPPLAIARFGSSPEAMSDYEAHVDGIGFRTLKAKRSLRVLPSGELEAFVPKIVRFRDAHGRVRPVAPFFEVWGRYADTDELVPVTSDQLATMGATPAEVAWRVHVANHKAYRRTRAESDRIEADTGPFSDHAPHPLTGLCDNFRKGKSIPFGSVQFVRPNEEFPELRLRFTPPAGKVYGAVRDDVIADDVYDAERGPWFGYADDDADFRITNPEFIYTYDRDEQDKRRSRGYLDDASDGIIEVTLTLGGRELSAHARVATGPPAFAPDSFPVRTIADELEQAILGPDAADTSPSAAAEIVRRALETVRLMNTAVMNLPLSEEPPANMVSMDKSDLNRALEPIMDISVVDNLAIRARHERVLLALESGTLAWFARMLREYDQVGDLSVAARRKMPALMRGSDGRHLALTRRQVSKIRSVAARYVEALEKSHRPEVDGRSSRQSARKAT